VFPRRGLSAPQLAALSFVGLIAVGTAGFLVLPGLYTGEPLGWVDALFMATSAVCVTGLAVVDISQQFTFWGQTWLLFLIQAGGLGILTLAGVIVSLAGVRMGLEAQEAAGGSPSVLPPLAAARVLRTAVGVTLALEAAGALALWLSWRGEFGAAPAAWHAVFHSVAAFCNAGFSTFGDSLVGFRERPALVLTVASLIVLGGLGFPVIQDLRYRMPGLHPRLTLHTRLVLATTGLLLAGSMLLYLIFEWNHELRPLGVLDRAVNALFMAVTARTAGFNTVDYDAISNPSLFLTLALMWIGGGPASTAGGVKITTAALLASCSGRASPARTRSRSGGAPCQETVQRASELAAGMNFLSTSSSLLVSRVGGALWADRPRSCAPRLRAPERLQHPSGLSMGATSELTPAGRVVLVRDVDRSDRLSPSPPWRAC
jgi:trk system potassium uptake protein TrkH